MKSAPRARTLQREREILDMVYGSRSLRDVRKSESPDFLLQTWTDPGFFGVEVTEFFESETAARLEEISDYSDELLGDGHFRHKDDIRRLTVDKVEILSETGQTVAEAVPAIIQKVPSLAACTKMVAEMIGEKSVKLSSPRHSLRHVNLIVRDRTHLLATVDPSDLYQTFCGPELRDAVYRSCFREIFYVTRLSSGWSFVPLKMLMALAELFYSEIALNESVPRLEMTAALILKTFASSLSVLASDEVRISGDETEVFYGDTGFSLDPDLGGRVMSYQDSSFPESKIVRPHSFEQRGALQGLHERYSFRACISFPVKETN